MFENLIPQVYAATATAAAAAKKTAAAKTAAAAIPADPTGEGVGGLFKFILSNLDNWIAGIAVVFGFYVLSKIVSGRARESIIRSKGEDVPEGALILMERVSRILIVGIGITIALAINGLNFTAVIGALSLGIGFALKDIIGNFISSMILLAQNRFRIGDFIQVGDIMGTIVGIDTRVTILQALDGSEVVVPNQTMLNQTVISFSTNPFRRVDLPVGVDYGSNLPMVTSLIKGVLDKHPDVVPKPESTVVIDAFGDSSIGLIARFWVESKANWIDIRSNLAHRIKKAFDEVGIQIPFPIRTLKLDEDDRSFLKTMDSMKKGVVPEKKPVTEKKVLQQAALGTADAGHVPGKLFAQEHADLIQAVDTAMEKAEQKAPAPSIEVSKKEAETASASTPPTHL